MAIHTPKWGPVETTMMEELFEPEVLRQKVPGLGDVLDGAAHMRALHEEIGVLGEYQKRGGFTKDRGMFITPKINTAIMVTLDHLHEASCMCGKPLWGTDGHKAWYYHWLDGPGRAFDVRGKIVL